jgi:NTE family protein
MSLPVFFEPFMYEGMCLVDGGLLNNIPVSIALEEGPGPVLAVNISAFGPVDSGKLRSGPQVIFRSIDTILHDRARKEKARADLVIDIEAATDIFSFFKQRELIELGVKALDNKLNALANFFRTGAASSKKRQAARRGSNG